MSNGIIRFTNMYSSDELAKLLLEAGCYREETIGEIINSVDADNNQIEVECIVDEDDVIEALSAEAILDAVAEIADAGEAARDIEDAITYVRAGDLAMARIMFSRVFEGERLDAAERALR